VRIVPISRILLYSICAVGAAKAQLVPSDTIGNDPAREKLCIERAHAGRTGLPIKGKPVP
jgi:hypothetical protein